MKTLIVITLSIFWAFSWTPSIHASDEGPTEHYKIFNIETVVDATTYKATIFKPTKTEIKYILVISPNIAGITGLEMTSAAYFSQHGYLVIMTHLFNTELNTDKPDTTKADNDYFKFAIGTDALLKMVDQQFSLPPDMPVFGLGSSQGAVASIIIASQNSRFKAIWTAVGGGDLPEIYAHSLVPQVIKFRVNHMKVLGIKDNNYYEQYLRAHLKNDPGISCKGLTIPFHQTIAIYDDLVPTITQEFLVDQCPPHSVKRAKVDHIVGALTVVADREEIKAFFESAI